MEFHFWLYVLHNFNGETGQGSIVPTGGQIFSRQETRSRKGGLFLEWNCEERYPIIILDEAGGAMDWNACKLTSKGLAKDIVGLPVQTTVKQMKESLLLHKNNVRKQYPD